MQTKWVKTVEEITSPKTGKAYWKITWQDGKANNTNDQKFSAMAMDAQANKLALGVNFEKNGNFWNISSMEYVKDAVAELPAQTPQPSKQVIAENDKPPKVIAPQEKGMWWKEVGENFRSGFFNKEEGDGAMLYRAYIAQMMSSLEITVEKKVT